MSWKKVFLGSLYELPSRNGLTRPSKVRGVGYKMVNMGELFANEWLYDIPMERVQLNDREKRECLIAKNDLLFARQSLVASGAGKCSIVREVKEPTTFESHLIRVRLDTTKAVPLFYYYYFKSPLSPMKTIVTICAQAGIRGSDLATLSVECPDLPTQRRIASILSAYDDLIENNRRQIKLLEEAAQRLYREWFVELRFPGHEGVKVVDGVPEGWKKVTIADSLAFHIGGGWGKETTNGKNTVAGKVIRGTDINDIKNGDFGNIPLRYHTENDILKRFLHPNDIVFELSNGNINNIGRCLMIDNTLIKNLGCNTICASFCKLLRPHDEMISHLLYWEIQDMQNSGRMLPLKKHGSNGINNFDFDGFLKHEFLLPLERRLVQPLIYIMQKISNVQSQLVFLREARDRLLSKLMSGETEA